MAWAFGGKRQRHNLSARHFTYRSCVSLCNATQHVFAVLTAGKTSLLRHLLENTKLKIGCIVNDVAAVNIDAKLIRNDRTRARTEGVNSTADLADTIELANGCACKRVLVTLQKRVW